MKRLKYSLLFFLVMALPLPLLCCAQTIVRKTFSGPVFNIPELGAIVVEKEGKLTVAHIIPSANRPKEYANVDLLQDDLILMVNGKKIQKTEEIKSLYEKLKTGEIFKMGISRNNQMLMVSLQKADIKNLPQIKRVIIKDGKEIKSTDKIPEGKAKIIIREK